MDRGTWIGVAASGAAVAWAILRRGSLGDFVDPVSLAVVVCGTFAGSLMQFQRGAIRLAARRLKRALQPIDHNWEGLVETIVTYADLTRRDGLLVLEQQLEAAPDPFLRQGLELIVDGVTADTVRSVLESEAAAALDQEFEAAGVLETMAQSATDFGMVGTVIGLIPLFGRSGFAGAGGSGLAGALSATLYGMLLANVVLLPLGGKIRSSARLGALRHELIMEGVLALAAGTTPDLLARRLYARLPGVVRRASPPDPTAHQTEGTWDA